MSRDSSHHSALSPAFGADDAKALRRLSAVMRLLETLKEEDLAPEVCREAVQLTGADYALLFLAEQGAGKPVLLVSRTRFARPSRSARSSPPTCAWCCSPASTVTP